MNAIIFLGPSISASDARKHLDALYMPPVSQGDIIRAAKLHPKVIGIIDGFFEHVPAVWHKEILWAMSEGIHVFGASSMGALRACELEAFGMVGVGKLFEQYRSGTLEDDDEVAVAHSDEADGYRTTSEAMGNIRGTFASAEAEGVIAPDEHRRLLLIAKGLFYAERCYPEILRVAVQTGLSRDSITRLERWLVDGRINQKRDDAVLLLEHMAQFLSSDPGPKSVSYKFEYTEWWDRAVGFAGEMRIRDGGTTESTLMESILNELRLDPPLFLRTSEEAMQRSLLLEKAAKQICNVDELRLEQVSDEFRRQRDLIQPSDTQAWIKQQHISEQQYWRLIREEVLIRQAQLVVLPEVTRRMLDQTRISGIYPELEQRAREKEAALREAGFVHPEISDTGLGEDQLWKWYQETLSVTVAAEYREEHARSLGWVDSRDLMQNLVREYLFRERRNLTDLNRYTTT